MIISKKNIFKILSLMTVWIFLGACDNNQVLNRNIYSDEYSPSYEVYVDNTLINRLINELKNWNAEYNDLSIYDSDFVSLYNNSIQDRFSGSMSVSNKIFTDRENNPSLYLWLTSYINETETSKPHPFSKENLPKLIDIISPELEEEEITSLSKYIINDLEKQEVYEDSKLEVSIKRWDNSPVIAYRLSLFITDDAEYINKLVYESDKNSEALYENRSIADITNDYYPSLEDEIEFDTKTVNVTGRIIPNETWEERPSLDETQYMIEDEDGYLLEVHYMGDDNNFNIGDTVKFSGTSTNITKVLKATRAEFIR